MEIGLIIGSVPPVLLLVYVWYLDRKEHEPLGLVAKVFIWSALFGTCCAAYIEGIGENLLVILGLGSIPVLGNLLFFFAVVALAEEFCKRLPVMIFIWNNPEFDHRFDAIVYCVASAIGFAVCENIMYIVMYGGDVAIWRLIPVHTICGVFMGFYLSCAKMCEVGGNMKACSSYRKKSLWIPVIIHGSWDFLVSTDSDALAILALVGVLVLSVYAFIQLRRYAKFDAPLWGPAAHLSPSVVSPADGSSGLTGGQASPSTGIDGEPGSYANTE